MNREYARHVIQTLLDFGTAEFYVCAGARNIPLVEAILNIQSEKKIVFNHFEERSAAFYALGRIKAFNKPIAVVTTSGTAVAELFPAVMEAYYSGLPLILLTADRPREFRGTGAPQAAEQKNIFGVYVSECFDLASLDDLKQFSSALLHCQNECDVYHHANICNRKQNNKPLHVNVCFDQPLQSGTIIPIQVQKSCSPVTETKIDSPFTDLSYLYVNSALLTEVKKLHTFIKDSKNLIVIVSKIERNSHHHVIEFLKYLNCPVYIESISNLRECTGLSYLRIDCADAIWDNAKNANYKIDSILKIGGTPTHRVWRDLNESHKDIKVFSVHELPFASMPNIEHVTTCLNCFFTLALNKNIAISKNPDSEKFLSANKNAFYIKMINLKHNSNAESLFVHELSKMIQPNARVYLGNSLAIRHWDAFATYESKNITIEASRGVNGIDGQISTFLGFADESCENWGIFGDLTTLYDLAGFWMLSQRTHLNVNIVVINNQGGKIFTKILTGNNASFIQNSHEIEFEPLAKMWGLTYIPISQISDFKDIPQGKNLLEVKI